MGCGVSFTNAWRSTRKWHPFARQSGEECLEKCEVDVIGIEQWFIKAQSSVRHKQRRWCFSDLEKESGSCNDLLNVWDVNIRDEMLSISKNKNAFFSHRVYFIIQSKQINYKRDWFEFKWIYPALLLVLWKIFQLFLCNLIHDFLLHEKMKACCKEVWSYPVASLTLIDQSEASILQLKTLCVYILLVM